MTLLDYKFSHKGLMLEKKFVLPQIINEKWALKDTFISLNVNHVIKS